MFKKKQPLSFQEVLSKLMRYCSYQERSPFEVKQKLREYALPADKVDEIMDLLLDDNFINEERFATLFVRGKVKVKRWGLYKIREGLSKKGVDSYICSTRKEGLLKGKVSENVTYLFLDRKQVLDLKAFRKLYTFINDN